MAKVIGEAGWHATDRSVRASQRMLMTTMLLLVAIGVFEGATVSSLFFRGGSMPISVLAAVVLGAVIVWRLCKAQNRRIDLYEHERLNWRTGAKGSDRRVSREKLKR